MLFCMPKKREYWRTVAVAAVAIGTLAAYWAALRVGTYISAVEHVVLLAPLIVVLIVAFWKKISSKTHVWLATACIYIGVGLLAITILGRYNGVFLYVWQWFAFYSLSIIIAGVFLMTSVLRSVPRLSNLRKGFHAVLWDVTSLKTWKHAVVFYLVGGAIGAAGGLFGDLVLISGSYWVFILPSMALLVWAWYMDMAFARSKKG